MYLKVNIFILHEYGNSTIFHDMQHPITLTFRMDLGRLFRYYTWLHNATQKYFNLFPHQNGATKPS